MIERKRRLTRSTFPPPQSKRVVVFGDVFTITFYPNPNSAQSSFCVVVSKKVHKTAIKRNQFKRWVYEAVRIHQHQFDECYKGVLVVSAKKTNKSVTYQDIHTEIVLILNKNKK